MASYSPPTESQAKTWTGISAQALGIDDPAFTALFGEILVNAEAEVAVKCGESRFDSSGLTARQAVLLRQAVCYQIAAEFLRRPMTEEAEGTNAPLLMEGESLAEATERWEGKVTQLAELVAAGGETLPAEIQHSFPVATLGSTAARQERTFTRQGTLW